MTTTAINLAVAERDNLRRQADALERQSDRKALDGDRLHEEAIDLASQATEVREEIKKYNVVINALGGEPKTKKKPLLKVGKKAAA